MEEVDVATETSFDSDYNWDIDEQVCAMLQQWRDAARRCRSDGSHNFVYNMVNVGQI